LFRNNFIIASTVVGNDIIGFYPGGVFVPFTGVELIGFACEAIVILPATTPGSPVTLPVLVVFGLSGKFFVFWVGPKQTVLPKLADYNSDY
jgi:hypothetical protein